MIVYHGSSAVVENPDVEHSFRPLDFGKGFYITSVREQAVRWAHRKAEAYKKYDIIMGKVANDKVFRVVDMFHSGIWDLNRALQEIKVYPTYDQIAFISQKAIDSVLKFVSCEEV